MRKINKVFVATSLDGCISDKDGGIDWLNSIPNPDNNDLGYNKFIENIDAIVMGRETFETVCSFDIDWPYKIPVFVLSNSLTTIPVEFNYKAELVQGSLDNILDKINGRGYKRLYIDGGKTIQTFLKQDLIDELIVTTIPVILGGGTRLFSELPANLEFKLVESTLYLGQLVQNHYKRIR